MNNKEVKSKLFDTNLEEKNRKGQIFCKKVRLPYDRETTRFKIRNDEDI